MEATTAGGTVKLTGTFVNLGNGQLLNRSFYRQFSFDTDKGSLNIRVSFPSSMVGNADPNLYKEHTLYEFPLSLQETGRMASTVAEAYFSDTNAAFFRSGNLKGKITLRQNHVYAGVTYGLFGEVDMDVTGKDQKAYKLKGIFWKK